MTCRIMWVAVLRALYLQALHPRVIRGTLQNAATITEPVDAWARLRRTRTFIETRTFGTTAEAERAGRRVRKIHDPLTGTDPDGTRYRVDGPDLYACDEAKQALRLTFRPPVPDGNRVLKLGLPPVAILAFSTLPGWARRMYGGPGGPLSDAVATAGLRFTRLAFGQQRVFRGALRAIHRAETAGD